MAQRGTNLHSAQLDAQGHWSQALQAQRATAAAAWASGAAPTGQAWVNAYRTGNHHIIAAPLGMANRPPNLYIGAIGRTDNKHSQAHSVLATIRLYLKQAVQGTAKGS